ncbi:MAG: glycoside hydrolase family 15 protein [Chloroflexi bacterium]|nr:MAG: glycoside hydrolase family 15 protein [Chloroflexota bacterium]
MRPVERVDGYLPIAAYGVIGDCRSSALVGQDGSIDWLCLPRFDDPSIFARILDPERGGHWQLSPRGAYEVVQRYNDRTNVLQTVFTTATGRVIVVDFMPIDEAAMARHASPHGRPRVIRVVECLAGSMVMHQQLAPRPNYARLDRSGFRCSGHRLHADAGPIHICVRGTRALTGPRQDLSLRLGDSVAFSLTTSVAGRCPGGEWSVEHARRALGETRTYWRDWVDAVRYHGPFQEPVRRSALVLKLMTYSPSGAIVAAPTTSLPEAVGGQRNWDYRFTWLRDASFTLYAFFQLGLVDEANDFFGWVSGSGIGTRRHALDNLYTLDGGRVGEEVVLDRLEGYRRSRPVRVGNGAAHQLQLDVYGEVLDSAYLYARHGGRISRRLWSDLHAIVELAIDRWQQPDASIWEVRGGDRHFTYSKVMCWVAIDRGLRLAERYGFPHNSARWRSARRAVHRRVVVEGFSARLGAFTQTLGSEVLDAAALRLPQLRFLARRHDRLASTVDAVARRLCVGDLVRRYDIDESDDGIGGSEGAFLACSFWLVDAHAHLGRVEDAQRMFERLLPFASPLGLFAEEADTRTGELLGNFPQAFTHLALVGAAVNIERARHRELGVHRL